MTIGTISRALLAAVLVLAVVPGCHSSKDNTAPAPCSDPASSGHEVVGFKTDRPRLTEEEGSTWSGFEPTMTAAIMGKLNLSESTSPISAGNWALALDQCQISLAVSSISWTEKRASDYYLTAPYLSTPLGVLGLAKNGGYKVVPDVAGGFAGQKVCYVRSDDQTHVTTAQAEVEKTPNPYPGMTPIGESDSDTCLADVVGGKATLFLNDAAILRGIALASDGKYAFDEAYDLPGSATTYVVAMKKDDDHLKLCNRISDEITAYTGQDHAQWWDNFKGFLGGPKADAQREQLEREYFPGSDIRQGQKPCT